MEISQLIIVVFGIFALSRVILRFRKRKIKSKEFVAWTVLWTFVIFFALIPGFMSWVAGIIGIGRGTDAITYLAILTLFYLIYKMYARLEKIEENITRLVRELALKRK